MCWLRPTPGVPKSTGKFSLKRALYALEVLFLPKFFIQKSPNKKPDLFLTNQVFYLGHLGGGSSEIIM
jgi:hypothetical protein